MNKIILIRKCPFCNKIYSMEFNAEEYQNGLQKYRAGSLSQNAFPNFTLASVSS